MSITCQALERSEFFELLELFQQLKVRMGRSRNADYMVWYDERLFLLQSFLVLIETDQEKK